MSMRFLPKSFGRLPQGARLDKIKCSPNYRDGKFMNQHATPRLISKNKVALLMKFMFRNSKDLRPDREVQVVKSDLKSIDIQENILVWFGHSSYMIQIAGKRFLVDPVFYKAAPISFANRPFKGTDAFAADDLPSIDFLIITHDHWDHLDYKLVTMLKDKVGKVICPLGVGEDFEYWGYDSDDIIEMDWNDDHTLCPDIVIHCLPARHFSGRGLIPEKTLWASFLMETPQKNIFIGGDGGYDTHFAEIGKRFPSIDLAFLENGQYNENWKYIHLLPKYLVQVTKDLNAKAVFTVHHSKYALSDHPWNEPLDNIKKASESINVITAQIGEIKEL